MTTTTRISVAILILALSGLDNTASAKRHATSLCENSQFYCHKVQRGESWEKIFPNDTERDVVMRINRMNTRIHPGMIIAIPKSRDLNIINYSPLPTQISATGKKSIFVSLHKLAFGAYDANGSLVHWGPISGGQGYCPDIGRGCHSPIGNFVIYSKGGAGCVSTKFPVGRGGAPMPYCMYFHGGFALHGSYNVPGYNASHGCIRMFVNDARWLNHEFTADLRHTPVIVRQ